jgi:dTMP kinase
LAADRAQHVAEVIRPALDQGGWVVSDRFSASTLAYQGYGRGLDRVELDRLIEWATGGLTPDLTVLLDVSPEVGRARRRGSAEDRIEVLGEEFRQRVAHGYRVLAETEATPWLVVDGSGPVEEVAAVVWSGVQDHLAQVGDRGR